MRLVQSLSGLAEFLSAEGRMDEAEPLYREMLDVNRANGDLDGIIATLVNLARIAIAAGAEDRAGLIATLASLPVQVKNLKFDPLKDLVPVKGGRAGTPTGCTRPFPRTRWTTLDTGVSRRAK